MGWGSGLPPFSQGFFPATEKTVQKEGGKEAFCLPGSGMHTGVLSSQAKGPGPPAGGWVARTRPGAGRKVLGWQLRW